MKVEKTNTCTRVLTLEDGSDIAIIASALEERIVSKIKVVKFYLRRKFELVDEYIMETKNLIQVLDDLDINVDTRKLYEELEKSIAEGGVENE